MSGTRISNLPWRDWEADGRLIADEMTSILRQPHGTMSLRPVQAVTLKEIYEKRGFIGFIRVGGGKTLVTALAPVVLGAKRPLLLVPAHLMGKTLSDFQTYREHFKVPHTIRIVSYTKAGRPEENAARLIEAYQPDLIMADEAHKLRHVRQSAVAMRVARWMHAHPETAYVGLSGSFMVDSCADYAHQLVWGLRYEAPIPIDENAQAEWAAILKGENENLAPLVPSLGPVHDLTHARSTYRKRLSGTPGVLILQDSFRGTTLRFRELEAKVPVEVEPYLKQLRDLWIAPDGWPLADARFEVWRVARQLALGFCYIHDPRPPEDWFLVRRAWCRFVREVIEESDVYDSEKQVAMACGAGHLPANLWQAWSDIKPTFTPNTVPVWFSDEMVLKAAKWGLERPERSLIWVEHVAFGDRLAAASGWSYYRENGLDQNGRYIEAHPQNVPAICSVKSNLEGRNLQGPNGRKVGWFDRNLVVSPLNLARDWEQLIGRTHREEQRNDVLVETFVSIREHRNCIDNAFAQAQRTEAELGQEQKLLLAER